MRTASNRNTSRDGVSSGKQILEATSSAAERALLALPLDERLSLAQKGISEAKAELRIRESDILRTQCVTLSAEERQSGLAGSITNWLAREYLAKVQVMGRLGLLDKAAREALTGLAEWMKTSEDRITLKLHTQAIPPDAAGVLKEALADCISDTTRAGSVLLCKQEERHDYPAWGPDDPAYTSRNLTVNVYVIGAERLSKARK
jgi:hypothetical protein